MQIDLHKTTDIDCPHCAKSKLTPKRGADRKLVMINGLSSEQWKFHETSSEGDETEVHTFALALECTNPDCRMMTIVVGRLDAYPDYNGMVREYDTTVTPRFFYPPIDVIPIQGYIPESIRGELRRSYALYFADPASAANPLRSAIECFMDETATIKDRNRKPLTLHQRLVEFKKSNADIAELLGAVKWLGNDGSHYGLGLTHDDLLKAYDVFLHAMGKWFADPELRVKTYAKHISKGRGL
ncbi:MAG: hypothetical protein A3H35_13075 [Betaproteobacteria bacterium RIFCSPLOWO2_02_FULL_62_17]|nr:MAG: hypothetical protein A3H35_13075 [Betaproteobacteria bacterium RIFCSPLOWO2_02_FULL_62_17]